ncbi:MAG: putative dipeptidase PepE [Chlamydiia bacterium]|nr:putative dipeptidase PepE [Chlamydiia bacterium]MCH9615352.1 putative dipeptidase PepE [Chlamydiia bacterium]MCH9628326.1 putative dipeptidase PepE [Chlamydiia bacterium]
MIDKAQKELTEHAIDGWLIYDFGGSNPLAEKMLGFPEGQHRTRRFFYWIPRSGTPVKVVHKIEKHNFDHLEGEERVYFKWHELEETLHQLLKDASSVAMEYSPNGAVPAVSMVDGGTIDMVKHCGVDVVSSGSFMQPFLCQMNAEEYSSHKEAMAVLESAVKKSWELLKTNPNVTEREVQQLIIDEFAANDCETEGAPIVGFGENSANPHYESGDVTLKEGDMILLDMWCKKKGGVFADITRMGVNAVAPSEEQQAVFLAVREAQRTCIDFIRRRYEKKEIVKGFEADEICRDIVVEKGFGDHFIHRTGHNIYKTNHGPGAHLDSLETFDERTLMPDTLFSVEPGVYLPGKFGVRLETDVFIHQDGKVEVTGGEQDELVKIQ